MHDCPSIFVHTQSIYDLLFCSRQTLFFCVPLIDLDFDHRSVYLIDGEPTLSRPCAIGGRIPTLDSHRYVNDDFGLFVPIV